MSPKSLIVTAIAFLSTFCSFAQPEGVKIGKKSTWIEPVAYDRSARPDNSAASSYFFLLLDEQENTLTQEDHYHYAYTILSSEGIQEMSDLTFAFDPSYQQLTFHEVKVIRGDKVIDQLSKNINLIQREQSMDRFLYDGSKTAVINLKDIRVGDIVEYSFTRKGYNPVHQGHIARSYYFDLYMAVDKYVRKVILSSAKKYDFKNIADETVPPVVQQVGNTTHYRWEFNKISGKQYDSGTPAWFESVNGVMLSDFPSWREVGEWGTKLFDVSDADRLRIKDEVAPMFGATGDAEYVLKAIRFVQDEVRYLGFETGINSHQPYPPYQVYDQRFGDCKDKSLLLVTLLQARDIEAYPMLVNTTLKHKLDDKLPAGNIFDHCVVQFTFNGKKIYIDPTISNQGGDLDNYYFPDYRRGLIIDNDISGLDVLPTPETSTTSEIQDFELLTIGGEAMLTVRTTYTRYNADVQRSEFARTPIENIQKNYREYYANLYPDITQWEDLKFTDNRKDNVITVEEKYKIPTFWKPIPNVDGKVYCVFQPQSITNYFDVPKNIQQRTSPYYLTYPVDFTHAIHVKLPEEWSVTPEDVVIDNDFYQYEYTVKYANNEISKVTHYMTKSDHIPAEHISTFVTDHAKMYDNLVYELTYDKNIAASADNIWPGLTVTIISLVAGAFFMLALYNKYDPEPTRYMVKGLPIGGWLILIGIGVVFTPLRLLYDFSTSIDLLTGKSWLTAFSTEQYGLFAFLLLSQVYNILYLLLSVVLIMLFFQRRSSFPRLMSIQIVTNVVVLILDSVVANITLPSPENFEQIVKPIIAAIIWVPYLNISQRVKDTFVTRSPDHRDKDGVEIEQHHELETK